MVEMNAAVVTSFDEPPHYQRFPVPEPGSPDELLVDVLAVGLHPRVRAGASGSHYTSSGTLPMIPGIDGVGRRPDGRLVYFAADDDVLGPMADKALAAPRRSIELPGEVDVAKVAAAMNPAMSSWVALRRRVPIEHRPERPRPGRHRQCRSDGGAGGQAAWRRNGDRRRARPQASACADRDRRRPHRGTAQVVAPGALLSDAASDHRPRADRVLPQRTPSRARHLRLQAKQAQPLHTW